MRDERRKREEKMNEAERLQAEYDRDLRTVMLFKLHPKVTEHVLWEFFSEKVGKLADARLIVDRISKKSKGIGYVEFAERGSVTKALAMSGINLFGMNMIIQPSQAEKNRAAGVTAPTATAMSSGPTKLYIGNLHEALQDDDLREIFAPFGAIEGVNLVLDPSDGSRNKGFGFVQFRRPEDARKALQQINGLEVAGKALRVGIVSETDGMRQSGSGGGGGYYSTGGRDLDDEDADGGLRLSATSRAMLMAKMQRHDDTVSMPAPVQTRLPSEIPSPCVLLKNMFDPTDKDEQFFEEIRSDVESEVSKFGQLRHLFVDPRNPSGIIYLKFSAQEEAVRAFAALNKRYFAGSIIAVEYVPPLQYDQKFALR
eukprot:TRINITY_DN583_c0_g1_i1.p1 TRINITY_DN583_c0_g1~~TRINITY_DN583_c0_g1_i1.p1  ORF type:complete len:369 (+),score=100.28 TRINITY_DN583_c0_g1_i1:534-1640(+)